MEIKLKPINGTKTPIYAFKFSSALSFMIFPCSVTIASKSASGRGGQPEI